MSRRARERLDAWLVALEREGHLRHGDRDRHADVLFTLLDGLSLHLLTGAITLARARAALRDVIATTVTS